MAFLQAMEAQSSHKKKATILLWILGQSSLTSFQDLQTFFQVPNHMEWCATNGSCQGPWQAAHLHFTQLC